MGEKARRSRILLRISPIISIGSLQQQKNKVMLFCLFKLSQISKISIFTYKHKTHNQMKNIKEFYSLETWGIGLTKRTLSSILSNMFSSQFTYSSFAQLRWLANHGCTSGLLLHNWFRIRNVPPSKKAMKTKEN